MENNKYNAVLAAALHDVGKAVIRANLGHINHSEAGVNYLQQFMPDNQDVLRAVKLHHASVLKDFNGGADDISYIVYEADNIASSTDRRSKTEDNSAGFSASTPLENIFNSFGDNKTGTSTNSCFYVRGLLQDDKVQYPQKSGRIKATSAEYKRLVDELTSNFRRCAPDQMSINELMQVVEGIFTYIPSSTAVGEVADISLYDHQKLTAALTGCMYDYFDSKGITDYREYCFGKKVDALRDTKTYLLASGDLSGIQKFIYTIPSKGALKSLRGRSFYLELILENIVDEVLEKLELSRANLLYTGGGNFYMLLPNTDKAKMVLEEAKQKINSWFLRTWGSSLYLAIGSAPCCANDFKASSENRLGGIYRKVSSAIARDKHSRYSAEQLADLFDFTSDLNTTLDGTEECGICHNSNLHSKLEPYDNDSDTKACPNCKALRDFGKELLSGDVIGVFTAKPSGNSVEIPGIDGNEYIKIASEEKAEREFTGTCRIYTKNTALTGHLMATRLWMGDYITCGDDGRALELEDLALQAGGSDAESGIKRLGVLRADVDNLGAAFMAGFNTKYATLGRTTALSRQLSLFFKQYVNILCSGEVNGVNESSKDKFYLFNEKPVKQRKVHIIYSGGDDMFIVGAWDELIELAVDIREAFRQFTNNKLSFSAGIGFFPPRCPVAEFARAAGDLESYAKKAEGKDSIALFGSATEQHKATSILEQEVFSWDDFENGVYGEKLAFLKKYLSYEGNVSPSRLTAGKGVLYRLLEFIRAAGERINLARFAYVMARLDPGEKDPAYGSYKEVRKTLYTWYQNENDRKQLATALELVIYRIREKGDKQ